MKSDVFKCTRSHRVHNFFLPKLHGCSNSGGLLFSWACFLILIVMPRLNHYFFSRSYTGAPTRVGLVSLWAWFFLTLIVTPRPNNYFFYLTLNSALHSVLTDELKVYATERRKTWANCFCLLLFIRESQRANDPWH